MGKPSKSKNFDASCSGASKMTSAPAGSAVMPCQGTSDCHPCPEKMMEEQPIVVGLCEIFCEVRCKNHERNKKGERARYSQDAKEMAQKHAKEGKLPKNFDFEKEFKVPLDRGSDAAEKLKKAGRKPLTPATIIKRASVIGGKQVASRIAKRAWMKVVPILAPLGTALDVIDVGMLLVDVYEQLDSLDALNKQNKDVFTARPDVVETGVDGKVKKVYDFKFDNPATGYKDTMSNDQRQLYEELTGGEEGSVMEIDQTTCDCGCKKKGTSDTIPVS